MQKMKIEYKKPEMELILLKEVSDVVTVSGKTDGTPPADDFENMGWG